MGERIKFPANTWIVSSYDFQRHNSLKSAECEAARLQSLSADKEFRIYRVKGSLEPSDARERIAEMERRLTEACAALAWAHRKGGISHVDMPEEHAATLMWAEEIAREPGLAAGVGRKEAA